MKLISLKNKYIALMVLLFAIMSEYFHKLFDGIWHSEYLNPNTKEMMDIYWSDIIYHFFNESLTLLFVTMASAYLWTSRAAKTTMTFVWFWFFIEWGEITLQMMKVINIRTSTSSVSWVQLFTCLIGSILVFLFGNKKSI